MLVTQTEVNDPPAWVFPRYTGITVNLLKEFKAVDGVQWIKMVQYSRPWFWRTNFNIVLYLNNLQQPLKQVESYVIVSKVI